MPDERRDRFVFKQVEIPCECGEVRVVTRVGEPDLFERLSSEVVILDPCPKCGIMALIADRDLVGYFNREDITNRCRTCGKEYTLTPEECLAWMRGKLVQKFCPLSRQHASMLYEGSRTRHVSVRPPREQIRTVSMIY